MDIVYCRECGRAVDEDEAHYTNLNFWGGRYTCPDCMRKYGEKCAKCSEFFYGGEGIEVGIGDYRWYPGYDSPFEEYEDKFLCKKCYEEVASLANKLWDELGEELAE